MPASVPSRRSVLTAGAWSAPAIALATAAPAYARSAAPVVHSLALATSDTGLNQNITPANGPTLLVRGTSTFQGSMVATSGYTSWQVASPAQGANPFRTNATWNYQGRPPIASVSAAYASRGIHTVTVTAPANRPVRDLQLTVARIATRWVGTPAVPESIGAIAVVTPGVVVVSHGSNLVLRAASGDVPEHYESLRQYPQSLQSEDMTTQLTLMRPGNVTSITFEVWNKAVTTRSSNGQTFHVAALKVTEDL